VSPSFALGCFWGDEKDFWQQARRVDHGGRLPGRLHPNATYKEVCTGYTGHAETVRVVFDPSKTSYEKLLKVFWESHDPTQAMRQGNDIGTQYRSAIFVHDEAQRAAAEASKASTRSSCRRRVTARSAPRSSARLRRRSTSPRTTTSSTWTRCRTATARITPRA
jgi:methionine-S-sulfoxide reductase